MDRLASTLKSTKVSKRLLMFHAHFLRIVGNSATIRSMDLYYGRPPQHLRAAFKSAVAEIISVDTWPGFFEKCSRSCPSPAGLTDILKQAAKNSKNKFYHSDRTDFSRIHASGVSHILRKGQSYNVEGTVRQVRLTLGSDSSSILCGACLLYEDLTCSSVVCYDSRNAYKGAVKHSGDMQVNGKSKHVIDIDLAKLPSSVTKLFLTLCSCGCNDLSGFKTPSIGMQDSDGKALCAYNLERAGQAPTVVMAAIHRSQSSWTVKAIGQLSSVRCCGDYSQVKREIAAIKL